MKRNRKLVFLLCLLTGAVVLVSFCRKKQRHQPSVASLPKADKVKVIKSKREMYLLKKGKVIKTYKVALGDQPVGHKRKEGDEKTPEGTYVLDWRNAKSSCYKSIHISYPNDRDKQYAKKIHVSPGGDIMIHGLHPNISWMGSRHCQYDWTDGCIAVTNEEMDEIWKSVPNGTPIEIKK